MVAVFQPHGFGPARFLRPELKDAAARRSCAPEDRFCYAEIFYAGGTVAKDISSRALADGPAGGAAVRLRRRPRGRASVGRVAEARPGDTVLVMGARDPDLPRLARSVFAALARA